MKEESISTKLQELFDLYKSGALNQEEYDLLKAELLNKSDNSLSPKTETKNEPEIDEPNVSATKPNVQEDINLSTLQKKLKEDPLNIELLHKYAQLQYDSSNYKETITITFKLLSLNENDAEAEKLLLNSYIKLTRYEDAVSVLKKWISKNPNEPKYKEKLAEIQTLFETYKRKRNRDKITVIASILAAIILIVFIIFSNRYSETKLALEKEKNAFELVKQEQKVSACLEFLDNYPNSKYFAEVVALQEEFRWKETKTSNTVHSYEKYLSLYPNGKYIKEANDAKIVIIDKIERKKQDLNTTIKNSNAEAENENNIVSNIKRDPRAKDVANVFWNPEYTLFCLLTDEPIFPDSEGSYDIWFSTNEYPTPSRGIFTENELKNERVYKFKDYEACKKWCNERTQSK